MRTVVLSALDDAHFVSQRLRTQLEEGRDSVAWVDLADLEFQACIACGACNTTGRCVLPDDLTAVVAGLHACDRLVLVTPIFIGVHHPLMKKAVDRLMPLGGTRFTVRHGEMHHRSRMVSPFTLVGIGCVDGAALGEEDQTFERLIARHAVNLGCPRDAAVVVHGPDDLAAILRDAFRETGGPT